VMQLLQLTYTNFPYTTLFRSNHQTPNNKPSKPTDEQLQNELIFHLAENMLMKLYEEKLISQEEFNQINKLNRQKFNPLLGPLMRSEEHTSELQSRFDLVCRLL